jgi:hypothetical protein
VKDNNHQDGEIVPVTVVGAAEEEEVADMVVVVWVEVMDIVATIPKINHAMEPH